MGYEIVEINEKLVAGIGIKTVEKDNQALNDIVATWEKFYQSDVRGKLPNIVSADSIGLYTDYDGDFSMPYGFYTCYEIENAENITDDLVVKRIPKGKYAKFAVIGNPMVDVGKLWGEIWSTNLDRKYSSDFELYYGNVDEFGKQLIEVYIAIF